MSDRLTRDLCQDDWQDRHPTEYVPDTIRAGECDQCGQPGLVYRSTKSEEVEPSHTFGNGTVCRDPRPLVWANSEDCMHDDSEARS